MNWGQEAWDNVIWSDETKLNFFGSDGRQYVRRPNGTRYQDKHLKPTVKHGGGSIMLFGTFSSKGVGKLYLIERRLTGIYYKNILIENLGASAQMLGMANYVFQQDNDPKHTSGVVKNYIASAGIKTLDWPSQSPDMNPIEHLWRVLKTRVALRRPRGRDNCIEIAFEEWYKISPEECAKLVKSMPERADALYLAKGGHTKY